MILGKKDKLEIERLREAEASLTQRVADLEEANRVLRESVERHRSELVEAHTKIGEVEAEAGRLVLDLERERALTEELRHHLAEAADVEQEAAKINARLDRLSKERADYETKIANLQKTIEEMRAHSADGSVKAFPTVVFSELEEEPALPPRRKTRPYDEPFRPKTPPTDADRRWLSDLPPF